MRKNNAEYLRNYRRNNPDRLERWQYNTALRVIRNYEAKHPEAYELRLIREVPDLAAVMPALSLEEMGGAD